MKVYDENINYHLANQELDFGVAVVRIFEGESKEKTVLFDVKKIVFTCDTVRIFFGVRVLCLCIDLITLHHIRYDFSHADSLDLFINY